MIRKVLFDNQIEVGISDIDDGKMRFFGGGDESEIIHNQEKLSGLLGLSGDAVARIRTTYDNRSEFTDYREITPENLAEYAISNSESAIPVTDGLVTKCTEVGILLPLADCLGAVVFDARQRIMGVLHAGRRNIEQDGPAKYIQFLKENYGCKPEDLMIFCSPYAVNYRIDALNMTMFEASRKQFLDVGILVENIIDEKVDVTIDAKYPSNSSGDHDKRFAIVAKMI